MKKLLHWIGIAALLLCGCHRNSVWHTLDVAESVMDERPDSALTLLRAIDGGRLRGETQARHALLLSQAYDKNYIDLTDDSLISIAVDFYERQDDSREKMLANFYMAVIYGNRDELDTALKFALSAERIATALGNHADLSRVLSMLTYIYGQTFNKHKALEYAEADLFHTKLSGNPYWLHQSYRALIRCLINTGNYHRAIAYVDTLRQSSENEDPLIVEFLIYSYAGLYDYAAVDSIYQEARSRGRNLSAPAMAYAAWANHALGRRDKSAGLLELASNAISTVQDSIELDRVKRDIAVRDNNAAEALKYQQSLSAYTDRVLLSLANNSLHLVQVDYEKQQNQLASIRHKDERTRLIVMIAVLILIVVILFVAITMYRFRQQRRIQQAEYNLLLLQRECDKLTKEINSLSLSKRQDSERISHLQDNLSELSESEQQKIAALDRLKKEVAESKRIAKLAFINQFAWIEERGMLYLDVYHRKQAAEAAYKELESSLDKAGSKSFRKELEDIINRNRDNLILRLREQCPKLTRTELTLLIYLCAGLSLKVITCIFKKQGNALYNQKHRIKCKLEEFYPEFFNEMQDIFA